MARSVSKGAFVDGHLQKKIDELNKLREFWTGFFKEAGAASISIGQNPI